MATTSIATGEAASKTTNNFGGLNLTLTTSNNHRHPHRVARSLNNSIVNDKHKIQPKLDLNLSTLIK